MKNLAIPGQYSGILKMYNVLVGKFVVLVGIVGLVFGVGCSTAMKSTLLGAGVGMAAGALLGSAMGQGDHDAQNRGTFIGAGIGAALGGTVGYLGYKQNEAKHPQTAMRFETSKEDSVPKILMPKARREWVPTKINGSGTVREEGHFIYYLDRPATWSPE